MSGDSPAAHAAVIRRLFQHIDERTTDLVEDTWREPVANYQSAERLQQEIERVLRRVPTPFCPSIALPEPGSYLARSAAGTPLLAVRDDAGTVRVFRNACRHRGAEIRSGSGCAKAFMCRYHGWTYGLDGSLRHVPHEYGFPDLDKTARGLVAVEAIERHGMVFVKQQASPLDVPAALPFSLAEGWRVLDIDEREIRANWKVVAETFLEGYHIRPLHKQTFYPVQYDNTNVVEMFGRDARIAFPYQAINKLRGLPEAQWDTDGKLTYLHHLFPNVMVATLVDFVAMVVLEPLAPDRTRQHTWTLTARGPGDGDGMARLQSGKALVDAGAAEDRAIAEAIQRGLAAEANAFLEFGRFEGAIQHFHRNLQAALAG